jgi:hypothetical protein
VDCVGSIALLTPARATAVRMRTLPGLRAVLRSGGNTVWAVIPGALVAISGSSEGARIRLPAGFISSDDYAKQTAWAYDSAAAYGLGFDRRGRPALVHVDFRRRRAALVNSDALPGPSGAIALTHALLWIGTPQGGRLRAYDPSELTRPSRSLELTRLRTANEQTLQLRSGGSTLWALINRRSGTYLFEIAS